VRCLTEGAAAETAHEALVAAAREFNSGRFFEAHEALEESLDDVPDALWELFLGLIQVAVGYHKITQDLRSGAERMLRIGLEKLDPFGDAEAGLRLDALRRRASEDLCALEAGTFDADRFASDPPRLQPLPRARRRSP
jgi:predicted metal-dependent hydrolase